MTGRPASIAALALISLLVLVSLYHIASPPSPSILLQEWSQPTTGGTGLEPKPTIDHAFRPILAHAAHPQSRKILLHSQPDTRLPFFDAAATDLDPSTALLMSTSPTPLSLRSTTQTLLRPKHRITSLNLTRTDRMNFNKGIEWEDVEVEVPDVTDRETLRTLAKMASNAYVTPESSEWWGLDEWNSVSSPPPCRVRWVDER